MNLKTLLFAGASALTLTAMAPAFAQDESAETDMTEADGETTAEAGDPQVLLAEWTGPYGGVPPFDKVEVSMFQPALEQAMGQQLRKSKRLQENRKVAAGMMRPQKKSRTKRTSYFEHSSKSK